MNTYSNIYLEPFKQPNSNLIDNLKKKKLKEKNQFMQGINPNQYIFDGRNPVRKSTNRSEICFEDQSSFKIKKSKDEN